MSGAGAVSLTAHGARTPASSGCGSPAGAAGRATGPGRRGADPGPS